LNNGCIWTSRCTPAKHLIQRCYFWVLENVSCPCFKNHFTSENSVIMFESDKRRANSSHMGKTPTKLIFMQNYIFPCRIPKKTLHLPKKQKELCLETLNGCPLRSNYTSIHCKALKGILCCFNLLKIGTCDLMYSYMYSSMYFVRKRQFFVLIFVETEVPKVNMYGKIKCSFVQNQILVATISRFI